MNNLLASRRRFLQQTTLVATAAGITSWLPARGWGQSDASPFTGKDPRLLVHSPQPGEIETPLALLREHRNTPKQLLFVRNNQTLAGRMSLDPLPLAGWKIEIAGLVNRPQDFDAAQLADLEQVEREIVLQCSGNGRAFFSSAAAVKGVPWQAGAMGNVVFAGVPLATVVKKLGLDLEPAAKFLTAEGRDLPDKQGDADFEHSIPLADALQRSILALRMNGEPIALHGGPVRLITPGFYATMNVKWLSRLRFEAQETTNHHQVERYRTPLQPLEPGSDFMYGLDNSEANWNMRIKSVIFAPLEGETLKPGQVRVRGVAWNDGQTRIESVHLSTDGQTWRPARLTMPKSPYAWHPWEAALDLLPGPQTIFARATDVLGRTQPLDGAIQWNPAGYGWSGVHRVRVIVS